MKRVLQINTGSKIFGGVSSFLFQVYKNIDKNCIQFDFLSLNETTYSLHRQEIEDMGANIYELKIDGNIIKKKMLLLIRLYKFLKENKYEIVHINSGSFFTNLTITIVCKMTRTKKIIVHSHNVGIDNKIKDICKNMLKPILCKFANNYFACSMQAAEYMFTRKAINSENFRIIKNGIDIEKFLFNNEIREEYREKFSIQNKFVICNIGRFVEQKNHKFLIDIFNEVYKKENNTILLLIGEGELKNDIEQKVKALKLEECVIFLGERKDIPNILQACDVFILPSIFEGLGIVNIEAQVSRSSNNCF